MFQTEFKNSIHA